MRLDISKGEAGKEECFLQLRRWLAVGFHIPVDGPACRAMHMSFRPRFLGPLTPEQRAAAIAGGIPEEQLVGL